MLSDNFCIQNNKKIQVFGCPGNEEYTFCITILFTERQFVSEVIIRADRQIYKYFTAKTRDKSIICILILQVGDIILIQKLSLFVSQLTNISSCELDVASLLCKNSYLIFVTYGVCGKNTKTRNTRPCLTGMCRGLKGVPRAISSMYQHQ